MAQLDPRYLAGLFDGEGTVCIARRYAKGNKGFMLTVGITNTYEPVIRQIAAQFGGHVHVVERKTEKHRRCFQWTACNRQAFAILDWIRAHVVVKARQVELAYEWDTYRLTRAVGRVGPHQPEKAAFVEERRALMLAAREQMMALNQGRVQFPV